MSSPVVLHVGKVTKISGSENHLLLLLPRLREHGYDVRFALLHEGEPGARDFRRRLEEAGVMVDAIRLPWAADPRAFRRLVAAVRRHRPAIVHTHLVHADFLGLVAGRICGVPVLASTKHGFNSFRERRSFATADRLVGRLADPHIAISGGLARYLVEAEGFGGDEFVVVHYGIEAGPEPPPCDLGTPRLLCVGRLVPIKGHDVLLRAFAEARDAVPGLELQLAGSGPLEDELRRRAEELRLGESVRILGLVSPIEPLLEAAGIVVVPSLGEGFGMVALEAMERGRAVIASDVGGLPEIVVDGETGLIVPRADHDRLAHAIIELASDLPRAAAMGRAGRERALDRVPAGTLHRADGGPLRGGARPGRGAVTPTAAEPLPGACEREGGEESEEEVPRHPVADGPGEQHRHQRVVGRQRDHESDEPARCEEETDEGQCVDDHHEHRFGASAQRVGKPLPTGVVGCDRERGLPQHPRRLRRESCLLARMLTPEVEHLSLVEGRLRAFVHLRRLAVPASDLRRARGHGGAPGNSGTSSIHWPAASTR